MIRTFLIAAALMVAPLATAFPTAAAAAQADVPRAADLTDAERAALQRVEAYLNDLDTMKARFVQLASDGSQAEGTIYLDRPGGLRIEYDDPTPILIVTDGEFLNYWDSELEQATYLDLEDTPASFLVQEAVSFDDPGITVTGFERSRGVIRVTVVRTTRPHEGTLTFVFEAEPLRLRKWVVIDAQGIVTEVSLLNARFGLELDPELFQFHEPTYGSDGPN